MLLRLPYPTKLLREPALSTKPGRIGGSSSSSTMLGPGLPIELVFCNLTLEIDSAPETRCRLADECDLLLGLRVTSSGGGCTRH